jgi:hypothetical protein
MSDGVPSELGIVMVGNKPLLLSPPSAIYAVDAVSSLQPAVNDTTHSPVPCAAAYSRPASLLKPLPSRPRSVSLPSTQDLPAELPGSILLENQGFPLRAVVDELVDACPISHHIQTNAFALDNDKDVEDEEEFSTLLNLFPEPLIHAKSVPDLGHQRSEMRSARSGNALNSTNVAKPSPLRVQHKNSPSNTRDQRHSRHSLVASPRSADSMSTASATTALRDNHTLARVQACTTKTLQPAPLVLREKASIGNSEGRESHRSEVSTTCFHGGVCLFVKQDAVHNETVSELVSFLCSTSIRRFVPEIQVHGYMPRNMHLIHSTQSTAFLWRSSCCFSMLPQGQRKQNDLDFQDTILQCSRSIAYRVTYLTWDTIN